MMLAILQVTFLLLTAWKLQEFDKTNHQYRPLVTLLATCWAGACLALAAAILLHWPETVSLRCVASTAAAGASCAAAFWTGGNVAELLRRCHILKH